MGDVVGVIAAVTGVVHLPAHSGHEHDVAYGWAVEPLPLMGLVVVALVYAGLAVAAHRRGQSVSPGRLVLFAAGLAVVVVALFSPIDPYGEAQSPAVHMIQHEMLLMVASILIAAGLEQRLVMPVSRLLLRPVRSHTRPARLWRRILLTVGSPWFAVGVWSVVTLGWHLPVMYNLSLANRTVHNIEHLSLLGAGILFWVVLIGRLPSLHHTTTRERVGALAVAMAVGGVVGAAFIWWPSLLYTGYLDARPWFGLSPWDDQRLAGFIMMVVDMPLLLGAMLVIAGRWARRELRSDEPHNPGTLPLMASGKPTTTRSPHPHA
ncbi:cytochrome c oxidase assembly protein [Tessaracoccus antarcticus]|uniref:Cytochrome c oxidase assembly protein n=1 Tax=Tessaracoccus antarcticus TaxID=2479848 RepID=A0A3M0GDZ7_9ACTN|nr:cytochrome c oxidase assembly protein [Tessaracoccus antarcticus]RMB59823.1 cytochrome c oxidase assembly protein [Tessaracoccus antarcticus]